VFGSGGSATQTGTGILEPTILTYFFTYLTLVGEFCGSAFTVAMLAATKLNAMIGTMAKRSKQQFTEMKGFRFIDGD
jgi:Mn2+/Fe2+ NRAMP family transporter